MKAVLLILAVFFVAFGCTPDKKEGGTDQFDLSALPRHLQDKISKINYLDTVIFTKAGAKISATNAQKFEETHSSEHKLLAEKFCKESKGYQNGVWEGENDCSWAVEKSKLENLAAWAARANDTLAIKLKNGEIQKFIHDRSSPDQELYYQFKNYLQDINFFVVEAIQKGKCRISHLVSGNDGSSFPINGTLYFSNDQGTFLASSFTSEPPLSCTNKIELYKIADAQIEKAWHIPTGDWGVSEARFLGQTEFLIEQSTTGAPSGYKNYARVSSN